MRHAMPAIPCLALSVLLSACETPLPVEQPPGPDAPVGTESGGAVVGTSEQAFVHFGAAFTQSTTIKVGDLLDDVDAFAGKDNLLIEGTAVDLCRRDGGWVVLSDGSRQIRVLAKDHGFSVDPDGIGAWTRAEGRLVPVGMDAESISHMEHESQRPELMPEKAGARFQFVATGIEMEDRD